MVHEETWELKVIIVQVGNMLVWSGCIRLCLMPTQTDRMSDLDPPYPDKADSCLEKHWTMRLDDVSSSISEALRTYRIWQPKTTYNKMFLSPTSNYESFTEHSSNLISSSHNRIPLPCNLKISSFASFFFPCLSEMVFGMQDPAPHLPYTFATCTSVGTLVASILTPLSSLE